MRLNGVDVRFEAMNGALPVWRGMVTAWTWGTAAERIKIAGGRLLSLWGEDRRLWAGHFVMSAVFQLQEGFVWLYLPLSTGLNGYPDLSGLFPEAVRMQRAVADLLGLTATGAVDARRWLRHAAWPSDYFPLRNERSGLEVFDSRATEDYDFTQVAGDGVHEIAVGPVHAGIIEPGHFRFSVVGEKVLRLEERLGYTHKGVEKLFERTLPAQGARIAGRISGDSTVAYAWAYSMALESALNVTIPPSAQWMRILMLEHERIANHLGDLGALGNDAGFAFGLTQFSLLRERWQRVNKQVFGHRFMMDRIVPGGTIVPWSTASRETLLDQCAQVEREVLELQKIYDGHAGLQDRFTNAGRVSVSLAMKLGLAGLAGRASGLANDLRADLPGSGYDDFDVRVASSQDGDVAARVQVRFAEIIESLRLIRQACERLGEGVATPVAPLPDVAGAGMGCVEGWRGPVFVALELSESRIRRCHCHDPSWHNWPVLEHAIIGNIVPDFPLINKSFNLSYSGHDL